MTYISVEAFRTDILLRRLNLQPINPISFDESIVLKEDVDAIFNATVGAAFEGAWRATKKRVKTNCTL